MKKILYLLALVLGLTLSTSAQAQTRKTVMGNTFSSTYDASKWEAERASMDQKNVIDAYVYMHTPLTEMLSVMVLDSKEDARTYLQQQSSQGIGVFNGATLLGEIDTAKCWGTTVYTVTFRTELAGEPFFGIALAGNVNNLLVFTVGYTRDADELDFVDVIYDLKFQK